MKELSVPFRVCISLLLFILIIGFIIWGIEFLTKIYKPKEDYGEKEALILVETSVPENYHTTWTTYQGIKISEYILTPLQDLVTTSCLDGFCLTIEDSCPEEEHKTGLAIDFTKTVDEVFNNKMLSYLQENAYKYGFVTSSSNPYHYRFIGVKHAKAMKESGLNFKEYVKGVKENGNIKS